jgi:porphobilinogen synthase
MSAPVPVASMPGVNQWPVSDAVDYMSRLVSELNVRQFILFGVTPNSRKDATGSFAASDDSPVNRTLRLARERNIDAVLYADLCFCEYTDHGHCGPLSQVAHASHADVDNDRTLELLRTTAVAQAHAGADFVAPSGMMDGCVGAVRSALDEAGLYERGILAYSVKYASNFYGPFRDAGQGGMKFGDRKGYQMDYRRSREWQTEVLADVHQGADIVMVKPALAYLDVIHQVRQSVSVPVAAYHVSGEFAMLHAAAHRGWVDLKQGALEATTAIRRAGADLILSYFTPDLARWLNESSVSDHRTSPSRTPETR